MNETNALLSLISDWDVLKSEGCAHSIRENGRSVERLSTKNIEIRAKEDGSGLDIYVAAATKGEKVAIPACITAAHIDDLVYNDFHIAEGADVTIIAGCGIHVKNGEEARHSGIHRFFLARGSKVRYEEKQHHARDQRPPCKRSPSRDQGASADRRPGEGDHHVRRHT